MDNVGIVVESLDEVISFSAQLGLTLERRVGEVVRYEQMYRLCYIRGSEGLLIGLAEEISGQPGR